MELGHCSYKIWPYAGTPGGSAATRHDVGGSDNACGAGNQQERLERCSIPGRCQATLGTIWRASRTAKEVSMYPSGRATTTELLGRFLSVSTYPNATR